jgi:1-phosphofructokinase family hexose kinase
MIYTVTPNPTLDKTLAVARLIPGEVHGARLVRQDLGGKGINVSLALRALGIESQVIGFVGGRTGALFTKGLAALGFTTHLIEIGGETRSNITLMDESSGVTTKINEPGASVDAAHVAALLSLVDTLAQPGDLWALCGSLPPGAPPGLYAQIIQRVQARGGRAFLDTSGAALRAGLEAQPYALKPNGEEAAAVLDVELQSEADYAKAAKQLLGESGAHVVVITRGSDGLLLATAGSDEVIVTVPPPVTARTPVGVGDAALAGMLWALRDGMDIAEVARRMVACGTAAVMQEGSAAAERAAVEALLPRVTLRRLSL